MNAPRCQTGEQLLLAHGDASLVSSILPPVVSQTVVAHCCQHEWARHLDDIMIRRTSWSYYHPEHLTIAKQVASWMAEETWVERIRNLRRTRPVFVTRQAILSL